jgi:hypothetical protein
MGAVPVNSVRYFVIMVMFYHGHGEIFLPHNILVVDFQGYQITANMLHLAFIGIGTYK